MSLTQAEIDTLKSHRAKGVSELTLNGERVKYRSLAEMDRIIREAEADLAGTRRRGASYPEYSRGT